MFLEKLIIRRIDTEVEWLRHLRQASEDWYNQLTEPVLPVLFGEIDSESSQDEEKYQKIAKGLLKEAFVVNAGDVVSNTFSEMGDRGIPLATSRERLQPLLEEYLQAGHFLKSIAFGFDPKKARNQWETFRKCKDTIVDEINCQLSHIG